MSRKSPEVFRMTEMNARARWHLGFGREWWYFRFCISFRSSESDFQTYTTFGRNHAVRLRELVTAEQKDTESETCLECRDK